MSTAINTRVLLIAVLFLVVPNAALADTGFIDRKMTVGGTAYRYQVYVSHGVHREVNLPAPGLLIKSGVALFLIAP